MASLISQNVTPMGVTAFEQDKSKHMENVGRENIEERREKKKRKQEQLQIEEQKQMKNLESFLFGSIYSPVEFGKQDDESEEINDDGFDSSLFFLDRTAEEGVPTPVVGFVKEVEDLKKPVWVDEEEEALKVDIVGVNRLRKLRKSEDEMLITGSEYVSRLRAQHAKMNPSTNWAKKDTSACGSTFSEEEEEEEDDDDDDDVIRVSKGRKADGVFDSVLRSDEDIVVKSRGKLLPGHLGYSALVDANVEDSSHGSINSVHFHSNAQLILVAGLDRRVRFFQIDGKRNTKIQSIFLEDCPVWKASFMPDGSQAIIAGRRKFFYVLDLIKARVDKVGPFVGREEKSLESFEVSPDSNMMAFVGHEGYILLVSSKTKELIGTLKMNGTIRSLAFTHDGKRLLSHGGDGHIYHWDVGMRTCLHKGMDDGCVNGTAVCASPMGGLFAAGSETGIVNVYDEGEFLGGKRQPLKVVDNLSTRVDLLKFNTDAQILAICSRMQKNSFKLVHVPSFTVFSNWPPRNMNLHYPRCADFSPNGGLMAIGNAAGKVLLYKLHHYNVA